MTGVGIHDNEEFENALVGLMLFVTTTDCSIIDDETQTRGGSFKDCFIEATGIGAGVALVAGLSKGVVSKYVVTCHPYQKMYLIYIQVHFINA